MNQPALAPQTAPHPVQNAPVPAVADPSPSRSSVAERAAALKAKLEPEDDKSPMPSVGEEPGRAPSEPEKPETDAVSADAAKAPDPEAEKRRTERQARIAQLRAKEEAANRSRLERQKFKVNESETEKLRKRVAELEPMEQAWASPLAMFEWAEKKGLKTEEVVKVLKEKLSDPDAIARRQTASVEKRLAAEIRKQREEFEAYKRQVAEERQKEREQFEGLRRAQEFEGRVTGMSTEYPLTAAFQKRHGQANLIAFANRWVAQDLPEEYSLEQLHDHLEQVLEELQVTGGAPMAQTSNAPTTEPVSEAHSGGAGQPTTTLNNRTTAGRGVVAEEVPLARLPKADRIRRLREKLDRE